MMIPCYAARSDGLSSGDQAGIWLSIAPAAWSFALAVRSRGLGTAITTFHLAYEEEAARLQNSIRKGDAGGSNAGRLHKGYKVRKSSEKASQQGGTLGLLVVIEILA